MRAFRSTLLAPSQWMVSLLLVSTPAIVLAAPGDDTALSSEAPRTETDDGDADADVTTTAYPATAPRPVVRRFALVIGSNHTLNDDLTPLRFADDDAARMTEVLEEAGVDVELVTTLDRDSQALFADLVSRSHRPTRAGLDTAWSSLQARMTAARRDGAGSIELLVYYSGHGEVGPDGQGYLTLDGAKLKRRDLFRTVLGKSIADRNHLLIDACKSEQFVLARGNGAWKSDRAARDYSETVGEYLDNNHLGHFPNTGVILALSADQQTHEWERYRGGVFTHQLVSGLRGGADLNGDGAIEYSELGAFVSAANHGVSDPRARLSVVVRPPKIDERHPLLTHDDVASRRVLYFPAGDRYRYSIEDSRGVRVADVRRSGEQPGYLRLPAGDMFIVRMTPSAANDQQEATLAASEGGLVIATALPFRPAESAARGSLDQAFRAGLFATPYGPGYYSGFTDRTGMLAVAEPQWHVEVWKEVDGTREKVAEVVTDSEPKIKIGAIPPKKPEPTDDDDGGSEISWGSVQLGTVLSPFRGDESIPLSPKRVTADQFRGCLNPHARSACSAVRGFNLRWQFFTVKDEARFPRFTAWVGSGYQGGHASFAPGNDGSFAPGDPTALSYVVVPLRAGGQIYLFDDFPLRPYAGLGLGLDIVRIRYHREGSSRLSKGGALVGFELHAGLELRITNYVALSAEIQQLWTARKRVDDVPDFSNTGLTFIAGIAAGFPLTPRAFRAQRERRKR
ncbi:MAG: caspase family protein [Nannocystaceae bacterium]|nr:caspase family protein [Nannocystaceae bacterium]